MSVVYSNVAILATDLVPNRDCVTSLTSEIKFCCDPPEMAAIPRQDFVAATTGQETSN
jgi:hypothetical protein